MKSIEKSYDKPSKEEIIENNLSYNGSVSLDSVVQKISERINSIQKKQKLSQEKMAEQLGLSRLTVSAWLNHRKLDQKSKFIGIDNIVKICNVYGVSPSYLFGETQEDSIEQEVTMNTYGIHPQCLKLLSHAFDHAKYSAIDDIHSDDAIKTYLSLSYVCTLIEVILSTDGISNLLTEHYRLHQRIEEYKKDVLGQESETNPNKSNSKTDETIKGIDEAELKKFFPKFFEILDIQPEAISTMSSLSNISTEQILRNLCMNKKKDFDEKTQEMFDKYGYLVIKYFDILSGITEMRLLQIENRLRWEQTQILLDFCQNILNQGGEYYRFSNQRARESGLKENKELIRGEE